MMKYALVHGTRICEVVATADERFPVAPPLQWIEVADDATTADSYVNSAVVSAPPVVVQQPPTLDEIYDQAMIAQRTLKALVLALNDGSLPVGTNKTGAQLKAIIKAKM